MHAILSFIIFHIFFRVNLFLRYFFGWSKYVFFLVLNDIAWCMQFDVSDYFLSEVEAIKRENGKSENEE